MKFYHCPYCGNLIEMIVDSKQIPVCCQHPMTELIANSQEAAWEKHIPIVKEQDGHTMIRVSDVLHPMVKEHYIVWIVIETTKTVIRRNLLPDQSPMMQLALSADERILNVYAYCNLHGLWKANI